MPELYTWVILLINQLGEIGEKQRSVFGPLMHVPLYETIGQDRAPKPIFNIKGNISVYKIDPSMIQNYSSPILTLI